MGIREEWLQLRQQCVPIAGTLPDRKYLRCT